MEKQKNRLVINDQLVSYYQFGSGKKSLIFLHGWRSNADAWLGVIQKILSDNLTIYALDMPGFGASPPPKHDFSLTDYADLVKAFIEKKELSGIVLIGHSFGGRIAIKLVADHPELIDKLILVDSAGVKKEYMMRKILAKVARPIFRPAFMQGLRRKIYKQIGSEDYLATPELKGTYLKIISEDLRPLLSEIKISTLLVWGENDRETPLSDAKIMKSQIKQSELEVIVNAGHFSFIDQPDKFASLLKSFVAGT